MRRNNCTTAWLLLEGRGPHSASLARWCPQGGRRISDDGVVLVLEAGRFYSASGRVEGWHGRAFVIQRGSDRATIAH